MTLPAAPPRVGVSACLLGRNVRYDGGHKREPLVTDELARLFELVPVCPEVDIGLGTPREPVRLVASAGGPRLAAVESGRDFTDRMASYARAKTAELRALGLAGFILKKGSPSCGPGQVPLWGKDGGSSGESAGLFALILRTELPDLPVEDEERLRDAAVREAFLRDVFRGKPQS